MPDEDCILPIPCAAGLTFTTEIPRQTLPDLPIVSSSVSSNKNAFFNIPISENNVDDDIKPHLNDRLSPME